MTSGSSAVPTPDKCPRCDGQGVVVRYAGYQERPYYESTGDAANSAVHACPSCKGSGVRSSMDVAEIDPDA